MKRFSLAVVAGVGGAILSTASAQAQSSPSAYTSATRYDAMGRVTGTIAPDPDGAGPLAYAATRTTYDAAGRPTKVETGELASWHSEAVAPASWGDFTRLSLTETSYDAMDRKTSETVKGSDGIPVSLVQYSYDLAGRLECTAQRMDPAVYGSLPASACTLGTEGSFGPDRITRNSYDAAGQLLKVQKAYATALQEDYATYTYSLNGKRTSLTDARGYVASMTYDGHDRQTKWNFPSPTTSGVVSTTDYEEYGYDANGNRTSLRKRDGSTVTYQYDALNRNTVKIVPERSGLAATYTRDVYYGYDLQGLQTYARFDSTSGEGLTTSYDGFGRMTSSVLTMDGTTRTLAYTRDKDGNRTQLTWPDAVATGYGYDGLDRMISAQSDGGAGATTFAYNERGLKKAQVGSFWTSNYYDPAGRLQAIQHDPQPSGGAYFVGFTYGYTPAGQMATQGTSNDAYAWTGHYNVDRNYTANGLNQYTAAGSATFTYDANGNLISDGARHYIYDVENRLVWMGTAGGSAIATLRYDPLGRLYETIGAGATTRFLHDGDELVAEYDGSGTLLRRYMHGTGVDDPIVWFEGSGIASGAVRQMRGNHQGSIILVADGVGNVLAINSYDEYGIPKASNLGRFQYTGQAWLPEIGMYYYKARIYSPTLGRFLQTDPIGYDDQVNLYAYVASDPVNKTDPTGMDSGSMGYASAVSLTEARAADNSPERAATERQALEVTGQVLMMMPQMRAAGLAYRAWRLTQRAGGPKPAPCCFVAGTLIDTEKGLRPIEEIKAGDLVWSRNPETGKTTLKPVTHTIPRHDREIWIVRLENKAGDTESFNTTEEHPWWVDGIGWVETAHLRAGMILTTRDNSKPSISFVAKTQRVEETYNLTIEDFETYFVGVNGILVHNCADSKPPRRLTPDPKATGPHSVARRDADGSVTRTETYKPNPQNPSGFDRVKSTDMQGPAHYNKVTGESVPTPHTQARDIPGGVRPARPDEIPRPK